MTNTGTSRILGGYLIFVFLDALLIWLLDPAITTYGDALWYCYAVISTAGFGDVVVSTFLPKLLSVLLTAYSLMVIALVTGVVVNYYTQITEARNKETVTAFLNQIEHLPEMSKEELTELSRRVREFRRTGKVEKV